MTRFALPDLGEGLTEAEIVSWHVSAGDHVVSGQPLVAVETAKAVVEIPSPQSGLVAATHGKAGEMIAVGSPLVDFREGGFADKAAIVGELPQAPARRDIRVSPALRAKARELGVDLARLTGSGPGGAITTADIEAAWPADAESHIVPLRGARRTMALNMTRAGAAVVPATVTEEADVSHWTSNEDVTVQLVLALKAAVAAEPRLNAWYDPDGQNLRIHEHIILGLALDTPEGLFVPALHVADDAEPAAIRAEIDRLKAAVLDRRLAPQDLAGHTITLSNFGMLAGLHASLVVMPPQVAIIGAGRVIEHVKLDQGKPRTLRLLPLSLTFDHRALTGGEAARFLRAMIRHLESAAVQTDNDKERATND